MIHTSPPSMRHKPSGLSNAAFTAYQFLSIEIFLNMEDKEQV